MSEAEIRAWAWESSKSRIIKEVEAYSEGWLLNGPSKAAAEAILNRIRRMPVPVPTPTGERQ